MEASMHPSIHPSIYLSNQIKSNQINHHTNTYWLVVSTPLKNMSSSVGMILPNTWENNPAMFQSPTTSICPFFDVNNTSQTSNVIHVIQPSHRSHAVVVVALRTELLAAELEGGDLVGWWLSPHRISGEFLSCHWIGLRENLQETMVFTIKYRAFL